MVASAIGELKTRSEPNSHCRPNVSLKTPPLPLTIFWRKYSSRLQSATSSPNITMRSSRFISSRKVALIRSAMVFGACFFSCAACSVEVRASPVFAALLLCAACVSKAGEVGSRSGEYRYCFMDSGGATGADDRIGPVNLFEMKIGESRDQARDISARSLHFDGHRNRVPVVFHQENNWQPQVRGRIHRLPELALAGGAVSHRHIGHFIAMKLNIFEFAIVPAGFLGCIGMQHQIPAGFGATHSMENLRAGAGRLRDHIQPLVSPMRRHLASAGTGVVSGADSLQQHLVRGRTQCEAKRAVAIVGEKP